MAQTHWLLVSGLDNFRISKARGFDFAGMKSRHRKKAEKVRAGDTVFFYLTGVMSVGGLATVTGEYFESDEPIWTSKKAGEEYPFRFSIKPDIILEEDEFVKIADLVPALEYVKRWPEAHWRLAFQGNVHVFSDGDFELIKGALEGAEAKTPV